MNRNLPANWVPGLILTPGRSHVPWTPDPGNHNHEAALRESVSCNYPIAGCCKYQSLCIQNQCLTEKPPIEKPKHSNWRICPSHSQKVCSATRTAQIK